MNKTSAAAAAPGKFLYVYFNNACVQSCEVEPGTWYLGLGRRGGIALQPSRDRLERYLARLELLKDGDATIRASAPDTPLYINNRPFRESPLTQGDEILLDGHLMIWGERRDLKEFVLANESEIPALIVEDGPGQAAKIDSVLPASDWGRVGTPDGDSYVLQKSHQQMSSLLLLCQEINTIFDLDALLEKCLEYIFGILMVDRAAILMAGEEGRLEISRVAYRRGKIPETIRIPESITQQAMAQQAGLLVRNLLDNPRYQTKPSVVEGQLQSAMAIPLARGGRLLGMLYADTSNPAVTFSVDDLRFLSIVANLTTIAMTNSHKLKTLEHKNRALEAGQVVDEHVTGESACSREVFRLLQRVADSWVTVLLTGESGTGKEVAARYLHYQSVRAEAPFVAVNCAAIPDTLIETELFGHERGAFTGAENLKPGKFELAEGGTLFLDEIGEMPLGFQAKLLRVLEGHGFERVGGTKSIKPRVRILTATNRNLREAVAEGVFRQDLYYRLTVFPIHIPPLRERREDILPLAEHFVARFARDLNRGPIALSADARDLLESYHWPGNIRELRNVIERAVILSETFTIGTELLAEYLHLELEPETPEVVGDETVVVQPGTPLMVAAGAAAGGGPGVGAGGSVSGSTGALRPLREQEVDAIRTALRIAGGNRSKAARLLGISRHHLVYRLKKYDIQPDAV